MGRGCRCDKGKNEGERERELMKGGVERSIGRCVEEEESVWCAEGDVGGERRRGEEEKSKMGAGLVAFVCLP
jgi:hypothetical protein